MKLPRFGGHLKFSDNTRRSTSWQNVRHAENVDILMISISSRYSSRFVPVINLQLDNVVFTERDILTDAVAVRSRLVEI